MSTKRFKESEHESDEYAEKVARWIRKLGMETPTIILLQGLKPLLLVIGELSSFFLGPFLLLLEDKGFAFIDWFEKKENIENLIRRLEHDSDEEA
jgi:hypothetical protein